MPDPLNTGSTVTCSNVIKHVILITCSKLKCMFGFWQQTGSQQEPRRNLKTHQVFSVHRRAKPEKLESATITGHFGFMFEKHWQGNLVMSLFSKSFVFKMLSVHTKTQSRSFQIPPIRKLHFCRI